MCRRVARAETPHASCHPSRARALGTCVEAPSAPSNPAVLPLLAIPLAVCLSSPDNSDAAENRETSAASAFLTAGHRSRPQRGKSHRRAAVGTTPRAKHAPIIAVPATPAVQLPHPIAPPPPQRPLVPQPEDVRSSEADALSAPWPTGAQVQLGQGPGGSFTHQRSIGAFDVFMPLGTKYLSVGRGVVAKVETDCPSGTIGHNKNSRCGNGGFGNHVIIEHRVVGADGVERPRLSKSGAPVFSLYAHMGRVSVREGDRVEAGTPIGTCGVTGFTTGPHLHFQFQRSSDLRSSEQLGLRDATFGRGLAGAPTAMLRMTSRWRRGHAERRSTPRRQ